MLKMFNSKTVLIVFVFFIGLSPVFSTENNSKTTRDVSLFIGTYFPNERESSDYYTLYNNGLSYGGSLSFLRDKVGMDFSLSLSKNSGELSSDREIMRNNNCIKTMFTSICFLYVPMQERKYNVRLGLGLVVKRKNEDIDYKYIYNSRVYSVNRKTTNQCYGGLLKGDYGILIYKNIYSDLKISFLVFDENNYDYEMSYDISIGFRYAL